jgi:hypothetical protein
LIEAPEATLQWLAEFTGASDLKPGVLRRKINTWTDGNVYESARAGYVPPAALTEAEQAIITRAMTSLTMRV